MSPSYIPFFYATYPLLTLIGPCHRVCRRHNCHVLSYPILSPGSQRHCAISAVPQNPMYQARDFPLLLAICRFMLQVRRIYFFSFPIYSPKLQTVIDWLTSSGLVKSSAKVALQDWNNALPNLLICIEMSLFAVLHFWGFPWSPYKNNKGEAKYYGGFMGWKAILDAGNPWDLIKATARGFRWLFVGRKSRTLDPSYHNNYQMANQNAQDGSYEQLPRTSVQV